MEFARRLTVCNSIIIDIILILILILLLLLSLLLYRGETPQPHQLYVLHMYVSMYFVLVPKIT